MTQRIGFGDNVRVVATPITAERGLAGATGQVYGETTPSLTEVDIIGVPTSDYAINVYFAEKEESFWFAPELLEFIDHAPGTTVTLRLKAGPKSWTRTPEGAWREAGAPRPTGRAISGTDSGERERRPWWRLW